MLKRPSTDIEIIEGPLQNISEKQKALDVKRKETRHINALDDAILKAYLLLKSNTCSKRQGA